MVSGVRGGFCAERGLLRWAGVVQCIHVDVFRVGWG